jgi:hypothetical protein
MLQLPADQSGGLKQRINWIQQNLRSPNGGNFGMTDSSLILVNEAMGLLNQKAENLTLKRARR